MSKNPLCALIMVGAVSLMACHADPRADEHDGMSAENTAGAEQGTKSATDGEPADIESRERVPGLERRYSTSEMQKAFHSVFKSDEFATIHLPQTTSFGATGKIIPFSVAPVAFEWSNNGAILITAAASENDSAAMLPGSDLYYIGVYYLRPHNLGFEIKAAYPTALRYWGSNIPGLSMRFTGKPVLIAGGIGSFTWMGQERYWDELYALEGREPELIGIIPLECGQTDWKNNNRYDETSGSITEILPNEGFSVEYKGNVSGIAKWEFRKGKFVIAGPYPKVCDHEYLSANREARELKPKVRNNEAGAR